MDYFIPHYALQHVVTLFVLSLAIVVVVVVSKRKRE